MREIKFRAWYKGRSYALDPNDLVESEKPQMIYDIQNLYDGSGTSDENYTLAGLGGFGSILYDDDFILMQFTGLHDTNGTPIYEGDIIKILDQNERECSLQIEYEGYSYVGTLFKNETMPVFTVVQYAFGEYDHVDYEFFSESEPLNVIEQFLESAELEVQGNIYQHPELIKEQD